MHKKVLFLRKIGKSAIFTKNQKKYQLLCKGIKSTQGLTWHKKTRKVVNHVFPGADRSKGLLLHRVAVSKYPKNHIKDPYKQPEPDPVEEIDPTELTGKLISGQVETRKLWNAWLGNNTT